MRIGETTVGFGYNGEYYNAATGQIYLRARFYEPEMNRFSQKDIVRGDITVPASLNRYSYVQNDLVNFIDPSGESLKSAWNSVKNAVSSVWNTVKTAAGEFATALFGVAATVIAVCETGKVWYKGYKDGTFIDLDEVDLPRIMVNPIPEIHKPVIEKLPLPDDDRDSLTESLPLPDTEKGNVTTLPLPDEKKDLIIEASDVGPYNWGNSDTLSDHFIRHGADVGASSDEDYA